MPLSDNAEITETGNLTKDDIIDFLGKNDEEEIKEGSKEEVKDKIEEKTEEKEEGKEEEEEEELEIKDEEEKIEEVEEPQFTIKRKEILKAFPEIFKKFPQLEKALYSNYKYREILPTLEDAEEAVEKAGRLDEFQSDLMKGNIEKTLHSIKQADNKAFARIIDNYLPTLHKVDEQAYYHVIGNVIKVAVRDMFKEGESSKNESLQSAAHILHQFMFGTSNYTPPKKLSGEATEDTDERKQLESEKEAFVRQKFESARNDIDDRVNNTLKSAINDYIDPKSHMTDFVKKHAVEEALNNLTQLIASDRAFKNQLDRLWEKAFSDDFSNESKVRIRSAYISKAKTLLKDVITKARNDALKGSKVTREKDSEDKKDRRGPITPGKSTAGKSGKINDPKDIPRGMSSYDFLMRQE